MTLEAIKGELAVIADRMRAIPFETPTPYAEYASLRERRAELRRAESLMISRIRCASCYEVA